MIIRDKIQIGSRTVKIEFIERLLSDADEVYGLYNFSKDLIQINSSYPRNIQEIALIHELRHFVWAMLGYNTEDEVVLSEEFIIQQQHYDHQILEQIIEWQKGV